MIFFKIISFIVLTVNIMKLPKLYKKNILTFVIFQKLAAFYIII